MATFKIGHLVAPKSIGNDAVDCYDWYQTMRKNAPIHYDRQRKCWDFFCYHDIKKVLLDYQTFSSERSSDQLDNLISMDPPEHKRFRSLADRDFGHRYIQRIESLIAEITEQTFVRIKDRSSFDFMQEIAAKIPILTMMKLLGIDEQYFEQVKQWSILTISRSQTTGKPLIRAIRQIRQAVHEFNDFLEHRIAEKLQHPQDDLMSNVLLQNRHQFDQERLRDFFRSLLSAGSETSVNLLGNSLYLFLHNSQVQTQLQTQPSLIPSAIEEVLRFDSSVHCINRFATRDISFGPHTIHAGQEVVLWLSSANRDEQIFPHADMFQIDRSPNPHLSFGHGIHYCLGNSLARLEAKIVFTKLFERFPTIRLASHRPPETNHNFVFRGYEHVFVELT